MTDINKSSSGTQKKKKEQSQLETETLSQTEQSSQFETQYYQSWQYGPVAYMGTFDPSKYKTKLCRHWKAGFCLFGKSCCFAHGFDDIQQPNSLVSQMANLTLMPVPVPYSTVPILQPYPVMIQDPSLISCEENYPEEKEIQSAGQEQEESQKGRQEQNPPPSVERT